MHRDWWTQIWWQRDQAGDSLLIQWVPSHLGVEGNIGPDQLAELGMGSHPNNCPSALNRQRTELQWEALGLVALSTDSEGEVRESGDHSMGQWTASHRCHQRSKQQGRCSARCH